jgi:micrococcal nuclease
VTEINRVVDGDTIDVTIDLGFDLYKKERVRVAGVDTPEKRTRNLEEKAELVGGVGKYGRLLGWLYIGDATVSINEEMIGEGYAWPYDGGTKQKDFEELRQLRRTRGTLTE